MVTTLATMMAAAAAATAARGRERPNRIVVRPYSKAITRCGDGGVPQAAGDALRPHPRGAGGDALHSCPRGRGANITSSRDVVRVA